MTSDALLAAANRVLGIALPDGSRRDLNEANTRAFVIDPIIAALGYAGPDQIELEVPVGRSGQSLDYVLTAHDIRIAVEAKSLQTTLADREASQLVGYIAQEGIRWAILTNGRDWHIFDNEVSGKWEDKRVAAANLEAAYREDLLADALRPLALFARDTLANGDAQLSAWSRGERARACLHDLLADPSSPLIRAAVEAIGKRGIPVEPADVVAMLSARSAPAAAPSPAPQLSTAAPAAAAPSQAAPASGVNYFLLSSWTEKGFDSLEYLRLWLPTGAWWIGPTAVDRLTPQPGDQCCFFATRGGSAITGRGIVATAEIAGVADQEIPRDEWPGPGDWGPGRFRLPLRNIDWLRDPLWPPREIRRKLDSLQPERPGQRLQGIGARSIRRLTEHDFNLLTGRS